MKKIIYLLMIIPIIFASCEVEKLDNDTLNGIDAKGKKEIKQNLATEPAVLRECIVENADRCPFEDSQPTSNFWWPGSEPFSPTSYFSSTDEHQLTFTEYDDGTANIKGSTTMGSCVVTVDVWLKDKKSWAEWSAQGGEHKKEGCAGDASNSEEMNFYVIDSERSTLNSVGGDCIAEGTFGLKQRPDPNDANTPNYGAHVGPGGANYDSELGELGLSTWGFITNKDTGENLWHMDFNFTFDCEVEEPECETAFAYSGDQNDCFLNYDFSRWGWTIGPIEDGHSESYDVYAGAGQCGLDKGEFVGTVDVSYNSGDVMVTYNIDSAYTVEETHTYAGNAMFPSKNGKPTVAPGQYSIEGGLGDEIYVIAHAVVCKD